ncbi:MAG: DNA internalization-related competence protein ComEC/Rec2 [Chloroflexota bacterium]
MAAGILALAGAVLLLLRRLPQSALLVLSAVTLLVAGVCYTTSLPPEDRSGLAFHNDSGVVELRGSVVEEAVRKGTYNEILVGKLELLGDGEQTPLDGKVLVRTRDLRDYRYGDVVFMRGELEQPPVLREFDYRGYLARQGIYSILFCPEMELTGETAGGRILTPLNRLRSHLSERIARSLHEPQASLAQALLLGERSSLPRETTDAFARAGAAHLLAVSGLHLGIVILAVIAVALALMGRQYYFYVWFALVVVWAYAALTGMRPPVVRAAIMASVFLMAELAGRQKHAPTALALAAAVMVGVNPQALWDVSFQLSVLAMGGLVAFYSPIRDAFDVLISRMPWSGVGRAFPPQARSIASATIAATVSVWPLGAATFGIVSFVGLPVSLLALPILPLAISASAGVALTASVSALLAAPFAWLAWLVLTYLLNVVQAFSDMAFAMAEMSPGTVFLTAYYVSLGCAAVYFMLPRVRMERAREESQVELPWISRALRLSTIPLALILGLVWAAASAAPDGNLHVVFFDVGQGDAALITSPEGRTVLIDGGPDGAGAMSALGQFMPFYERDIDLVISTQPHADHLGGLVDVVERMDVGMVLQSPAAHDSLLCDRWEKTLEQSGLEALYPARGQRVDLGDGTVIDFLGPRAEGYKGSSNDIDNNGLIARVSYGEASFLFAADVREDVERAMVRAGLPLNSTVLKVGHHGSSTSSCAQFLAAVSPSLAVVSVGADNEYGHPHAAVLDGLRAQGCEFLTTAQSGTVECISDGKSVRVFVERVA